MKRLLPRLLIVAVFSASATLAEAQAVARGSGGGGSTSSSSSGGGSSSSGGSSSGGGSTTSSTSSGGGGSSYSPPSAPTHSYAPPRTPSHSGGSSSSGGSYAGGSNGGSRTPNGGYNGTAGRRADGGSTSSATAPTYARPDGSTGYNGAYAIPRQRTPGGRPPVYYYSPYYVLNPWGFGFFGYGYGLNYFYDPFYFGGLGYPGYGYGYPGGYGYYGSGGYDNWADSGSTYESSESAREREQEGPTGELRIKVKPREAKVMVDGVVMGVVDDFDGAFQKLSLTEGHHQISLQLEGYETVTFDVVIIAGQTVNYKGELHKLADVLKKR
jgi:hypothetical protein